MHRRYVQRLVLAHLRARHTRPILLQEFTWHAHCSGRTLCGSESACSSIRGETARDRKFGRPRTGLARARRGVTRDGAGKRRCELISLFSVHILFSKTLVHKISSISVCITFHALMYGVLALLDRHARVVASSRVISTSTARTY